MFFSHLISRSDCCHDLPTALTTSPTHIHTYTHTNTNANTHTKQGRNFKHDSLFSSQDEGLDFFAERLRDESELMALFSWAGGDGKGNLDTHVLAVYSDAIKALVGKSSNCPKGLMLYFREGARAELIGGAEFHHSMVVVDSGRDMCIVKNMVPAFVLGVDICIRADMSAQWGLRGAGGCSVSFMFFRTLWHVGGP